MMIMRTAPDAARAEREDSKNPHQSFRDAGFRQNGVVLLIVINHKQPQYQQAGEHTANRPDNRMKMPQRPKDRRGQQECSRKDAPPALKRIILRKRLRREDELVTGAGLR